MLKAEAITKLKSFGLDTDKLIAAVTNAEEVDFELPEVTVFKADELTSRDTNIKSEGEKEGFKKGKEAGLEIAGKAIVKKFNLENVDHKDPDKIIEALNNTVAKGDNGLKEQIALLQKDKEAAVQKAQLAEQKALEVGFDKELISMFPVNRTSDLSDDERLILVKNSLQFETDESGQRVVKKGGEIVRNPTTKDPLPVKDALATLFTERKWTGDGGSGGNIGRAGGDNTPGGGGVGIKKYSDAVAKWKADNPTGNEVSPECTAYVGAIAKDATDFDWNS